MTFQPLHVGLALWLLILLWRIGRSLRRGEHISGRIRYARGAEPLEYWFAVLFEAALALALLWWAYRLAQSGRSAGAVTPLLLLVGAASAFWLLRSLQLGSTRARDGIVQRRARPGLFWTILLIQLAATAGAFWLALFWAGPGQREQGSEIYAVTKAIRERGPEFRNAGFSRVRLDARSRQVCGVLTLRGGTRRFFGNEADGRAVAIVEEQGRPDFDPAYRSACSGPWILPKAG